MAKKRNKKRTKGRFSRVVVIFCIVEMAIMQIWGMLLATKYTYSTHELITANHLVFGGELLFLCIKRIFAKEDKKNANTKENIDQIIES